MAMPASQPLRWRPPDIPRAASRMTSWVWLRAANGRLSVSVGDNGIGGAVATPGGGLHGIDRRLAAFDRTATVASPVGGPTVISLELPCGLSSEKI